MVGKALGRFTYMKSIALIPLREGSKTIPNKNIKIIAGKPLCYWSLNAAYQSCVFDKIIVSTDSKKYAQIVKGFNFGIEVIMRPKKFAMDSSSTESVMIHMSSKVHFDTLVTIQVTSPLVNPQDFIYANKLFNMKKYDSLFSGVRIKRFIWSLEGKPLNYNPLRRPRRQTFDGSIVEDGSFYFTKRYILEKFKCRLGGKIGIYEMGEPIFTEIDEKRDWAFFEKMLLKIYNK